MDWVVSVVDRDVYCWLDVFVRSRAPRPTWRRAMMSWMRGGDVLVVMRCQKRMPALALVIYLNGARQFHNFSKSAWHSVISVTVRRPFERVGLVPTQESEDTCNLRYDHAKFRKPKNTAKS